MEEYHLELERAKLPGYVSRYDDAYESDTDTVPRARQEGSAAVPEPHFHKYDVSPQPPKQDALNADSDHEVE